MGRRAALVVALALLVAAPAVDAMGIYDNGDPDGANGLSDIFSVEVGFDREVADDFILPIDAAITDCHYSIVWNTLEEDVARSHRVRFYEDDGGQPAMTPISDQVISTWAAQEGDVYFGRTEIQYSMDLNTAVQLSNGTPYWVSIQPEGPENAFWLTTGLKGGQVHVDYADVGFPKWTPGSDVFPTEYDVSYKLTIPEPATLSLLALGGLGLLRRRRQRTE